jgi:hypothetical protein
MTQELYIRLATLRRLVVNNGRQETWPASLPSSLGFDPNRTNPDLLPLSLRIFRARFLRELFRFEWLRQESDLAIDVLEQPPLHNRFAHFKFIAWAQLKIKNPRYSQAEGRHDLFNIKVSEAD